ncbi:MAG: helix-turn-helix transcriptional regulator [Candidatus Limnocylindrales bacterium]
MTTRDQLRRAVGADPGTTSRTDGARSLAADAAPTLPERLLAGRERKGVDLYRAERDTKIRARYLAALERGDYRELPGPVYTKGFLRNYALYLGLDPDDVLLQWRRERGGGREPQAVIAVPRPLVTPRPGPSFSPSLVVFVLMTIAVLAFGRTWASSCCASRSHRRSRSRTPDGRRGRGGHGHRLRPARDVGGRSDRQHRDAGSRPVHRQRGRRRPLDGQGGPPSRPEPVRCEGFGPGHREAFRGDRSAVHHRSLPRHRDTDPVGRSTVGRRNVREWRHPHPG